MGSYDDTGLLSVSGLLGVVEASCCACFVLCGPFDEPFDELRDHSGILDVVWDPGCGKGSYDGLRDPGKITFGTASMLSFCSKAMYPRLSLFRL